MLSSEVIKRIRAIFLHQEPSVSIADAAIFLGWPVPRITRAITGGDIETISIGSYRVVPTAETRCEGNGTVAARHDREGARP